MVRQRGAPPGVLAAGWIEARAWGEHYWLCSLACARDGFEAWAPPEK